MKLELNRVAEDPKIRQAKNFFTSRDGWFTLIGAGIGALFVAIPYLFIMCFVGVIIYIFVIAKLKGDTK